MIGPGVITNVGTGRVSNLPAGEPVWIMGFVYEPTDTHVIVADKAGTLHSLRLMYVQAITPACIHSLASAQ